MDIIEFHELMRDKHEERQFRNRRLMRMLILCNAALGLFLLSFALAYLRYAPK